MSDMTPPGWYYAEGDPPGTNRYWDGEMWQGAPQPVAPQPAAMPYRHYPESSQATTAIVLSILGFVCCGLLFPVGWKLGHDEVIAIDTGRRDPNNRGTANAARIIGMIGTGLLVLGVLGYIILIAVGTSSGFGMVA